MLPVGQRCEACFSDRGLLSTSTKRKRVSQTAHSPTHSLALRACICVSKCFTALPERDQHHKALCEQCEHRRRPGLGMPATQRPSWRCSTASATTRGRKQPRSAAASASCRLVARRHLGRHAVASCPRAAKTLAGLAFSCPGLIAWTPPGSARRASSNECNPERLKVSFLLPIRSSQLPSFHPRNHCESTDMRTKHGRKRK